MIVEQVRNLTEEDVWVYGTSGKLIKLRPTPFNATDLNPNGRLVGPKPNTYYIADGECRTKLEKDWRYRHYIATAKYKGSGRKGEKIYSLKNFSGKKLELISDNVRPEKNYFKTKHKENWQLKYNRSSSGGTDKE